MRAITKFHSENGRLICVFDMNPQTAVEEPRFIIYGQPVSFAPARVFPWPSMSGDSTSPRDRGRTVEVRAQDRPVDGAPLASR